MNAINCPYCGEWTRTVYIHGSEKCPRCKRTVEDCCNGEQQQVVDTKNGPESIVSEPNE